jgi:hypothetical protein
MFRPFFAISAGLLTAVLALPVHANTILTTGTETGTVTTDFTTMIGSIASGTQSVTGSGVGVLGAFTLAQTNDVALNTSNGQFTVTDGIFTNTYSGGTLFGTYSGGGTSCGGGLESCGTFPTLVTGGTGAFSGYTGSITELTTLVNATGSFTGSFTGTLTTPVGVPGPTIGAGPPGLIVAGGGLLLWWRRTRRAQALA